MCQKEQLEYVKDKHNDRIIDTKPKDEFINYFDNIDMRTDIIDDIPKKKNADESGRKEKDGFKYDIEKINKERKEMTPIIKE